MKKGDIVTVRLEVVQANHLGLVGERVKVRGVFPQQVSADDAFGGKLMPDGAVRSDVDTFYDVPVNLNSFFIPKDPRPPQEIEFLNACIERERNANAATHLRVADTWIVYKELLDA